MMIFTFISESEILLKYERDTVFKLVAGSLPSASMVLANVLISSEIIERSVSIWKSLAYFLLPLLMERGHTEELKLYLRDLRFYRLDVEEFLQAIRWFVSDVYEHFYTLALRYCDAATIEELFAVTGHNYDSEELFTYVCNDVEVYKKLAVGQNYEEGSLTAGFACMEPEDWLEWLETLPISKEQLINDTKYSLQNALVEGYTHFAKVVTAYLTVRPLLGTK